MKTTEASRQYQVALEHRRSHERLGLHHSDIEDLDEEVDKAFDQLTVSWLNDTHNKSQEAT